MIDSSNTRKRLIPGIIICAIMATLLLFVGFYVPTLIGSENEDNTVELTATVAKIENDKQNNSCLISVDEYKCKLFFYSKSVINSDALSNLKNGEKIFFRIIEGAENLLNDLNIKQVSIASLKTAEHNIISLGSQNKTSKIIVRITSIVFAIIFIFCILILAFKFRKRSTKEK